MENNNQKDKHNFYMKVGEPYLTKFLTLVKISYNRYLPVTIHGYNSEKFTALYTNFIEECYEYKEEAKKFNLENIDNIGLEDIHKLKFELIDMIIYLGLIYNIYDLKDLDTNGEDNISKVTEFYTKLIKKNYEDEVSSFNAVKIDENIIDSIEELFSIKEGNVDDKELIFIESNFRDRMFKKIYISLFRLINNCIFNLTSIRRMYPERKWHKPHEPLSEEEEINTILPNIRNVTLRFIMKFLNILIYIEIYEELINYKINKKFHLNDIYKIENSDKHLENMINIFVYKSFIDISVKQNKCL